ncbi:MAG: M18 family aminopeptidase [Gammaproteobacteria bacterium]|nr:M18 family aminopeptidase [Gammaproteobacteria bacterium]
MTTTPTDYTPIADRDSFNQRLLRYLDSSPTPFHACAELAAQLGRAGYQELQESAIWQLQPQGRYLVRRNGGSLIAFTLPAAREQATGFTLLGAHSDSPNLRLKPQPTLNAAGVTQWCVEPYGGVLLHTWFDRALSLAGRFSYCEANSQTIKESLIKLTQPVAVIPSLAIHLDSEANSSHSINKQNHLLPVIGMATEPPFNLAEQLFRAAAIASDATLLGHELMLYDTSPATLLGFAEEFIHAARLDNLLSCFVISETLQAAPATAPLIAIISDHEEVGSGSASGAAGSFVSDTLQRIVATSRSDSNPQEAWIRTMRQSLFVSCDNAHAQHPNFSDKHDPRHAPIINGGPVLKINSNQRYASNSRSSSQIQLAAATAGVHLQQFVARSDMGCGSTIGPLIAARLGVESVDIGLPQYAMHSIRETAGSNDAHQLQQLLLALVRQRHPTQIG